MVENLCERSKLYINTIHTVKSTIRATIFSFSSMDWRIGMNLSRQICEDSDLRAKKIFGGLQAPMGEYSCALGGFGLKKGNMSTGVAI